MAREPKKLADRDWGPHEIVQGDVLDPDSLVPALENIDIAYYMVHGMGSEGNFEERDARSARNFATVAAKAGVKRIIYLGGLGRADDKLSPHLKSRQRVGEILKETGIPVTELRASIIIGSGSASFEIIRDLVRKLPVMITPKWVRSRCEPISIDNVLSYLTSVLETPETVGKTLEIGGGRVLTYADMMKIVGHLMNRPVTMIPVPVLSPRLSAYWLNIMTAVPYSLASPLIGGLKNDTVCTDVRIRKWIPITLHSFEESVKTALQEDISGQLESHWTGANLPTPPEHSGVLFRDVQQVQSPLSASNLFKRVQTIGGKQGWYYADWIWKIRGALDRMVGGIGMRRGRRHPVHLRVGDAIDFWRVERYDPPHRLRLRAEMKVPGVARLEFQITETDSGSTLTQTASLAASSRLGDLYWYALVPIHRIMFRRMAHRIANPT
jgi:uncharacterized protein YbjT (DUF2867 family)